MAKRQPKDFSYQKPDDKDITDPAGAEALKAGKPFSTEYPKHLHKFAGEGNPFEYVEVLDEQDEAEKRAEGYASPQEVNAAQAKAKAKAPKPAVADAPAKPAKPAKVKKEKKAKAVESDAPKADSE